MGEVKAVFWAKGVENIYFEDPETHYQVLESMEGYWIGKYCLLGKKRNSFKSLTLI